MAEGFLFNQNKCVGCHACVVACQIENGSEQSVPWREISTYNSFQHPGLPVFHNSLACNHCEEAPCKSSCPALAYTRDEELNTIVFHAERCIGCSYCTWACPYDAPKYVNTKGIVEKCTSCQHRLLENKKPACANLCPTGALDYGPIASRNLSRIPGFTEAGIQPGIEIIPLRKRKAPRSILKLGPEEQNQFYELENQSSAKISPKKEWVLVFFTLLVPILTAWMATAALGSQDVSPWVFGTAGISGLILSTFHLGKKQRAWRSVLNLRNSWLSREILGYGLFLLSAALYFSDIGNIKIAYLSVLFGFFTCYAIDKVYLHIEKSTQLNLQSNSVFLTALLLTSLFIGNFTFAIVVFFLKVLLYMYRKSYFILHRKKISYTLTFSRILVGFILPGLLWYLGSIHINWILAAILAGELIDRFEFYSEAEIITPRRQILKDLIRLRTL